MLEAPFFDMTYISLSQAAVRLLIAAILAMVIGFEREVKDKPVGVRAFMLVGLGAAAFALMTMELAYLYDNLIGVTKIDPSRVIQGVIGGIGFLGAGALIHSGDQIRGTGTGASIWCAGAIGLACGFGFYWIALVTTLIAFAILTVIAQLRKFVTNKDED